MTSGAETPPAATRAGTSSSAAGEAPPGVLNRIVRFSIRFRGIVIALAAVLVGYGLYTLTQAPYDVFPDVAPPQVMVQTEAPGLAPEQVEQLVTQPIENALNGVAGLTALRSSSIQGLSVVTAVFEGTADIYRDRQVVAERLAALAGQLPAGVSAPTMQPLTTATNTVLTAGLTSDTASLMTLRTVADWTVRPHLLAVPGVAGVQVFGGEAKQLQVQVRPDRLLQFNLSLADVLAAASRATGVQGAGFIDTENQRIVLQTEGQNLSPEEIARTAIVTQNGTSVTLGTVARVRAAPAPAIGAAAINGTPGVSLVVTQQYGSNTLEVGGRVERALADLRPALAQQGVRLVPDLFRPANFIEAATHNVRVSLLLGGVLVVVVLVLFLFDLRTAAISCTAIPLSLLTAVILLERLGYSLNTMTLGGLAIAIGEVVDDAVIDVENILRRLRGNRHQASPRPAWRVVLDASIEVRSAVVYATFAVVLVFLPILTLSGLAGRLFGPLGLTYIFAILASLVVALTVTPALALVLLGARDLSEHEPPTVRWLKVRYVRLLERVEERPRLVIGAAAVLLAAAFAALPFFGAEFIPQLRESSVLFHMAAVPGTSIEESLRIGGQVTAELRKLPFVTSVYQQVGRAAHSEDTWGTHYSEFYVVLRPMSGRAAEDALYDLNEVLERFPGVSFSVMTFLVERLEETLSGQRAPVVVNIYGNALDSLDRAASDVARVLAAVPGARGVQIQAPVGAPQLAVRLRDADVARWGLGPVDVLHAVRTAFQGDVVAQLYDGNQVIPVAVVLDPGTRTSVPDIGNLPLRNAAGTYVPLRQLADLYETSGRYAILHQGARRVQTVTTTVSGRDVGSFVRDAKTLLARRVALPPGSYLQFTGSAEEQARTRRELLVHSLIAAMGIVLLLSVVTRQWRNLLLVLANVPFALVGGVLAVAASGGVLSIGSLVGFVTLFGITLRNSIMLISHYEHLVAVDGMPWGLQAAVRGAAERLAPILMTAVVTGLGLLPLALASGTPGREIEGPMALVILGGLVTSTALNLVVLPTLALRVGRFIPTEGAAVGVRAPGMGESGVQAEPA